MNLSNLSLEIHLVTFFLILLAAAVVGFLLGRSAINKAKRRILEVEDEMLNSNKEVLKYAEINKQLTEALEKAKIPVPSISKHSEEDEKVRKIHLGKIG
jgi:hypothetical protein